MEARQDEAQVIPEVESGFLPESDASAVRTDPAGTLAELAHAIDRALATPRSFRRVYATCGAAGDSIRVRLTVKQKTVRKREYGEARWDVEIVNGATRSPPRTNCSRSTRPCRASRRRLRYPPKKAATRPHRTGGRVICQIAKLRSGCQFC